MTITYPITPPASPKPRKARIAQRSVVAMGESPFTLKQVVQAHPGQAWRMGVALPPMKRDQAAAYIAALASLNGSAGTFLLGDAAESTPRGIATGTPLVRNRKNLLTYSEAFDNAAWSVSRLNPVTPNVTTAFDGTLTADKIVEDTDTGAHFLSRQGGFTFLDGTSLAFPIYLKAAERSQVHLVLTASSGNTGRLFDLATGLMSANQISGVTDAPDFSMEPTGDGWYRCFINNNTSGVTSGNLQIRIYNAADTYIGDGTSGIYVSRAQLEPESTAGPYLKTTAAAIADQAQSGGVLYSDGWTPSTAGILKAGDWLQLGSGAATHLHKVLADVDSDAGGVAAIDIWPNLRAAPADNDAIVVQDTVGLWRLDGSGQSWDIDEALFYGLSFDAVEAL